MTAAAVYCKGSVAWAQQTLCM